MNGWQSNLVCLRIRLFFSKLQTSNKELTSKEAYTGHMSNWDGWCTQELSGMMSNWLGLSKLFSVKYWKIVLNMILKKGKHWKLLKIISFFVEKDKNNLPNHWIETNFETISKYYSEWFRDSLVV